MTEHTTITVRRELGGKIRVTSALWEDAKAIDKHEVLEVRNVGGRLHIARKERHHNEWDPKISRMTLRAER